MFEHLERIEVSDELYNKYNNLVEEIRSYGSAAIAFSGGVDSSFLLYATGQALGERALAVTALSKVFTGEEAREAREFCQRYNIRQVEVETDVMSIPGFAQNPPDRCYICKKAIFSSLIRLASEEKAAVIMDGSNLDDEGDYRPGMKALAELEVKSPLRICGFTKEDIRILSRHFGLPSWNKPSFACLASRFPYGESITEEGLSMVEEGEAFLHKLGFQQFRVRIHGSLARIELLPQDISKFLDDDVRNSVSQEFSRIGFSYTALDVKGYRTGSMNEVL